jgi:hypothetical protein
MTTAPALFQAHLARPDWAATMRTEIDSAT